jgi:hypothetical protein
MGDKVEQKQADLLKVMAAMWKEIGLSSADAAKAMQNMEAASGTAAEYAKKRAQRSAEELANLKEARKLHMDSIDLGANTLGQAQAKERAAQANLDLLLASSTATKEEIKKARLRLSIAEEQAGAQAQIKGNIEDTATALTGVSGAWKNTLIGSFFKGDFAGNMQQAVDTLKAQFSAANMLGSALMKVQEATLMMVVSADATFASVNQLTNGTGEYNDIIMDTMQNNAEWNVSMEDAGEAVGALYTDMSNFSNMTEEAQGHLVEATAQLKGLGIDAQTTAANFEILNGALGMTAEQAVKIQKDFAAMAADLGVSAGKIAKDFEANSDVFTAYGDDAVKVFKEVAAAAKATGIEMSALLGITTKFDTFEGAATAAGQLNAVLGGGLVNSMDLLNATEAERIRMLIQAVSLSGKQWSAMSKFEKMAVANAAGISDMTVANKTFGQSLSEFDEAARKVEDNAEAQEKLAERAAAAASIMDKMRRIMEQFAVAVAPIVDAIHWMLNGFLALNDMLGGMLVPTLIGLLAVYKLWSIAQKLSITGSLTEIVTAKLKALWGAIVTKAKALQTAATNLDTTSTFWNTTATQSNTLATMRSSAAKHWNTVKTWASTLATKISTFFNWGQAASQTAVGTTAVAAAPGTFILSRGITAIGKAAMKYIVPLTVLAAALLGLGLAIAAPILLVAVIIWSLKDLTIAMLEMTDAIGPALMGLVMFIGIVSLGLPVIALAIVSFFWILSLAIKPMALLTPVLPQMVFALMGIGIALWILGKAIKQFVGDDMPGAMALTIASLIVFGIGLFIVSFFIREGALMVGLAVGVLGFGLLLLGRGLQEWNNVGVEEAAKALISLFVFGLALLALGPELMLGAFAVGLAVLLLGFGLMMLGKGLQEWNNVGMREVGVALAGLWLFGISLLALGMGPLPWGALLIGIAVGILGLALQALAKGIKEFNDIGLDEMILLGAALSIFALTLVPAGWALKYAGVAMLIGAIGTGFALFVLAKGVKPWMDIDISKLPGLGWALAEMAAGLFFAGVALLLAGYPLLMGSILVSAALMILNKPLRTFFESLALLAPVAAAMPAIAMGLMILGAALPVFAFGILMLGIAASLPFFSTGMSTLVRGIRAFGRAMGAISEKKAIALGHIFKGLTLFTDMGGIGKVFHELAWGVLMLAWALQELPEEKSVSLAIAADSFSGMMKVAMKVKPQAVETVKTMAAAASDYATASRLMREPEKDALVQAIKEAMGERKGKKGGKTGQDIVLEIDGNEFARAVDQAIDSRHSTSGW